MVPQRPKSCVVISVPYFKSCHVAPIARFEVALDVFPILPIALAIVDFQKRLFIGVTDTVFPVLIHATKRHFAAGQYAKRSCPRAHSVECRLVLPRRANVPFPVPALRDERFHPWEPAATKLEKGVIVLRGVTHAKKFDFRNKRMLAIGFEKISDALQGRLEVQA